MRASWLVYRFLLLAAAVSLAMYIPYKYATQLHAIDGLYFYLFPLSPIVAMAGIVLAYRPQFAFSMPLWIRSAVSLISVGWIATGVLCIPSLSQTVIAEPLRGFFATFHMTAQHIFLSLGVAFFMMAPLGVYKLFRQPVPGLGKEARDFNRP